MYVLMVVPSDFPNGDAGSVRDDAFAQIYRELGYEVRLVGKSSSSERGTYDGTEYISVYRHIPGIKGQLWRFLYEHREYRNVTDGWIKKYGLPAIIHINSVPEKAINYLVKIAKKNGIPIVHDSVEWYSPCEFKWGKADKAYILKDRLNRKVIRKPIRVFSISAYLDHHFKEKGLKSCRIPVVMDVVNAKKGKEAGPDKIRLIYAGSPATKDFLREMVLGVEQLDAREQEQLEFNIFGATEEQVRGITGLEKLSGCIRPQGRVPREWVQDKLLESDFAVLLRPEEERYAMAGFPTKSVEAMSHGVAMLCNISSDLGMYLKDKENSVIVDGHEPEDLTKALRKVLSMSRDEIHMMKRNARLTAEQNFDYRLWKETVKKMIEV